MSAQESTRYMFTVEGSEILGTLADYAKAWEYAHYSGNHLSPTVLSWSGVHHPVQVVQTKRHDDYLYYELSANGETAHACIDGRA